jgi:hypothetical protein
MSRIELGRYVVVPAAERSEGEVVEFRTTIEVEQLLLGVLSGGTERSGLRRFLGGVSSTIGLDDTALIRWLARQISSRKYRVYDQGPGSQPPVNGSTHTPKKPEVPLPTTRRMPQAKEELVAIEWFRITSITFCSDHGVMREAPDFSQRKAKSIRGSEWEFEKDAKPISHSMDEPVRLMINFESGPSNATPRHGQLRAVGLSGALSAGKADLTLEETIYITPGRSQTEIVLETVDALPRKVQTLNANLRWELMLDSGESLPEQQTGPHAIYVTYAMPKTNSKGSHRFVSSYRLQRAIEWAGEVNHVIPAKDSDDPHWPFRVIRHLMAKFPNYDLSTNPAVPPIYDHPKYWNTPFGVWGLMDYPQYGAHCVVICRLVYAIAYQLGLPIALRIKGVAIDGKTGKGQEGTTGMKWWSASHNKYLSVYLMDSAVEEGAYYPASHTDMEDGGVSPGFNTYESCLIATLAGKTSYFGGGAGEYRSPSEVVSRCFWGAVAVEYVTDRGNDVYRIVEIIARYRIIPSGHAGKEKER